jgi:hypothetical protein
MKTSDVLLYGLIAFGVYELLLKPPTPTNVVHPVTPGLPVASASPNAANVLSSLTSGIAKLLGGSSAPASTTQPAYDPTLNTGVVFTPVTTAPVEDTGVLSVTDSTGVTALSTGGIYDPNAADSLTTDVQVVAPVFDPSLN